MPRPFLWILVAVAVLVTLLLGATVAAWLVTESPATWPGSRVAQAQEPFAAAPDGAGAGYTARSEQGRSIRPDTALLAGSAGTLDPTLTPEELTNIRVYEGANRGVVNILTKVVSYDRFFMLPSPGEGAGSGSVIDKQGHILTNNHVIEDARAIAAELPRSYEALVRDSVRFRVGRIVYAAFSRDETIMGFAFPKEEREALVASDPSKFLMPRQSDMRYRWVEVRLAALADDELRELLVDAWRMCVPKKVAAEYDGRAGAARSEGLEPPTF